MDQSGTREAAALETMRQGAQILAKASEISVDIAVSNPETVGGLGTSYGLHQGAQANANSGGAKAVLSSPVGAGVALGAAGYVGLVGLDNRATLPVGDGFFTNSAAGWRRAGQYAAQHGTGEALLRVGEGLANSAAGWRAAGRYAADHGLVEAAKRAWYGPTSAGPTLSTDPPFDEPDTPDDPEPEEREPEEEEEHPPLRLNLGGEGELKGWTDVNPLLGNKKTADQIRAANPTGQLVIAGAEDLPFADDSATAIVANALPTPVIGRFASEIAKEAVRVATPDAVIRITSNSAIFSPGHPTTVAFESRGFKVVNSRTVQRVP